LFNLTQLATADGCIDIYKDQQICTKAKRNANTKPRGVISFQSLKNNLLQRKHNTEFGFDF